jgi:hypothetical protein
MVKTETFDARAAQIVADLHRIEQDRERERERRGVLV